VEVREANLGPFFSFWRIALHIARLGLGKARSLAVLLVRWDDKGFQPVRKSTRKLAQLSRGSEIVDSRFFISNNFPLFNCSIAALK
jgi:hypothetical protein